MADSTSTPKRAARARTGSKRRQKGNPPKKPGRPSKIHTAKASVERFLELIAEGNFGQVAASAVGIDYTTILRWDSRGRDGDPEFTAFAERYARAKADAETRALNLIHTAALVDPNHAKWFLEHRYPDRWNRRTVDVTGLPDETRPAPRDLSGYTTAELEQLRTIELARAQRDAATREAGR